MGNEKGGSLCTETITAEQAPSALKTGWENKLSGG